VAPAGRTAAPPPPRFKGQPGGGIPVPTLAAIPPPRGAATATTRSVLAKLALVPPPSGAAAGNLILSRVSPLPSAKFRRSHRGDWYGAGPRTLGGQRGVPPPSAADSFSCPSTGPGRCPGGSPGATTRLRRGRRASRVMK
jgi:hypothetical protein